MVSVDRLAYMTGSLTGYVIIWMFVRMHIDILDISSLYKSLCWDTCYIIGKKSNNLYAVHCIPRWSKSPDAS